MDLVEKWSALSPPAAGRGVTNYYWQPMETAPRDRCIAVLLEDNVTTGFVWWEEGLIDSNGNDCGGWSWVDEEPPDSWTEGYCWEVNEDLKRSMQPVCWRELTDLDRADD